MNDKGQVFIDKRLHLPRLKTSQKRKYRSTAKENHLQHTIIVLHMPFPSRLTCECRMPGLSWTQSRLTKHCLLILSAVQASAAVSLGDPMLGDLHSNKEQLTCFTTRHEEKKLHSGASWDFFFVVGWRPIFFLPGRELPVFL